MSACRHCGFKRGHHSRCNRRQEVVRRGKTVSRTSPTTAAELVAAIRSGLAGCMNPSGSATVGDESAVEVECDDGIWLITVKRVR